MEQNKLILEKFQIFQKQSSLCYSGANSIDCDGSVANLIPPTTAHSHANQTQAATSNPSNPTHHSALQIPTISTNSTR